MKILIFYTPRSKSTMVYHILKNFYNLEGICDVLTLSRIANQNFDEYETLINNINSSQNTCVKINSNDFIDLKNKCVNQNYKKINYKSFDKIIFITRNNYLDAVLSYAYMNPKDQTSWHRKKGETKVGVPYKVEPNKLFYLFRGYFLFNKIKNYICDNVNASKIYQYEYESVDEELVCDFNLSTTDIDIAPNELNYTELASNYGEIAKLAPVIYQQMAKLSVADLDNESTFFWEDRV